MAIARHCHVRVTTSWLASLAGFIGRLSLWDLLLVGFYAAIGGILIAHILRLPASARCLAKVNCIDGIHHTICLKKDGRLAALSDRLKQATDISQYMLDSWQKWSLVIHPEVNAAVTVPTNGS